MLSSLLNRSTKIICTLGPSSNTYEKIHKIAVAGMDVARVNFSHGNHKDHLQVIEIVRKVSEDIGKPIAILQDLQGPKIRIGTFEKGKITLKPNDDFTLTTRKIKGNQFEISVSFKELPEDVKPGDPILLDDGNIRLEVVKIKGQDVHCRVIYGGILKDHKGLNLPGTILNISALTEKDIKDLKFGVANKVDYVALSFVQKPKDIELIKAKIKEFNGVTPVIAKIEKPQAVDAIGEISDLTDGIMIARGDLGVEMETAEVPPAQKMITLHCNMKGIPVITATQMLESMMQNPRPTRAEASDVANAVLDGSDAVMLSGETAAGEYPVEAVENMSRIIELIENTSRGINYNIIQRRKDPNVVFDSAAAIGYSACDAAELIRASAIVCLTQSGSSAIMISRFRPNIPIITITPSLETYNRMALIWGIYPMLHGQFRDNFDHSVEDIIDSLKEKKYVKKGMKIVLTAGAPFDKMLKTNTLRIETIN